MARKERWEWEDRLAQFLSTKPAEVVQEACQVLEEHGCPVENELKSGLYFSSIAIYFDKLYIHTHMHMRTLTHTHICACTRTQTHFGAPLYCFQFS